MFCVSKRNFSGMGFFSHVYAHKTYVFLFFFCFFFVFVFFLTGPRSAVGNVSGYRCVSDCRSRGREYHTFVEIDHEIISMDILLPSADLFKKGCCQLQAKVCTQITG